MAAMSFRRLRPFDALAPGAWYRRVVPPPLHRALRVAIEHLPRSDENMGLDFKLRRFLTGLSYPPNTWAPAWMAPLTPEEIGELTGGKVAVEELYADAIAAWEGAPSRDPVDRLMEFFTRFYLQDDILAKTDRASMMHSLKTRAVFLDNDLVEFCRRLPRRFKYRGRQRKYLLRRAAEHAAGEPYCPRQEGIWHSSLGLAANNTAGPATRTRRRALDRLGSHRFRRSSRRPQGSPAVSLDLAQPAVRSCPLHA